MAGFDPAIFYYPYVNNTSFYNSSAHTAFGRMYIVAVN